MKKFAIIVSGSRTYNNYTHFKEVMNKQIEKISTDYSIAIIHGAANGVDTLAQRYANEKELPAFDFPANWKLHGRAAGMIRNEKMLDFAIEGTSSKKDILLIAFPSEQSVGTRAMIRITNNKNIKVVIEEI